MTMTYEQAIEALKQSRYQTLEGLRTLVNQVSTTVLGASANTTTLFYSGSINGTPTYQLAESISANSGGQVVTINQTDAAKFLEDRLFTHKSVI